MTKCAAAISGVLMLASSASAQSLTTRVGVLQAEDRRAPTLQDLATLRAGARSGDPVTARVGLRALGRLERPALIPDITPGLRHALPEVRAEAANAIAQAAQGLRSGKPAGPAIASVLTTLTSRLDVEADAGVRAALCESMGRLPFTEAADAGRAEATLVAFAQRATTTTDRLGIAKGLEAFTRATRDVRPAGSSALDLLRSLARPGPPRAEQELLRESRVRRLALESLITAGATDDETVLRAADDPDPQVRRLAVRAALDGATAAVVARGLTDPIPMVRIEALRTARLRNAADSCNPSLAAASDPDTNVALVAIDQLSACGGSMEAVAYLSHAVAEATDAELPRNWHRAAHAIVALATAAPDRVGASLEAYSTAHVWQLRLYTARAAAVLRDRTILERLAHDPEDNVVEAAITGLTTVAGHKADAVYLAALERDAHAVVRAAAMALDDTPLGDAVVPALKATLERFERDDRPGAIDARSALRDALTALGAPPKASKPATQPGAPLEAAELRRLASPRARFTVRDVGSFDVALFTMEAPATVLRFAQLVASGYYNGLTFHRVVPNMAIQGGSPGANEYSSDAPLMRDEVGLWPHVRGAVGISTRGRDTGDGQIFIDLVDSPRFDHTYTVFAQVLNGLDLVDRILEGDVIESVEIVP